MEKKQLRSQVLEQLNQITYQQYRVRSQQLAYNLLNESAIMQASTIAITISNQPEVDTTFIIEQLWKMNKQVVVPKCIPKERSMKFYAIDSFLETERSFNNILEPIVEITEPVKKADIDVIVVPGVVFDKEGYRIGFGGGYYDRYLQDFHGSRIAVAFNEQIMNEVPKESHDLPVHILLTETERILCQQ